MSLQLLVRTDAVADVIGHMLTQPLSIVFMYMAPHLQQPVGDAIAEYAVEHPRRNLLDVMPPYNLDEPNSIVLLRDTGDVMVNGCIIDNIWREAASIVLTQVFDLGLEDFDDIRFRPMSDYERRQNNGQLCRFERLFDVVI